MAKTRNPKQKFLKVGNYVFRRRRTWSGITYEVGEAIPEALASSPGKLQAMWDSGYIEHAREDDENVGTKPKSKKPSKGKKSNSKKSKQSASKEEGSKKVKKPKKKKAKKAKEFVQGLFGAQPVVSDEEKENTETETETTETTETKEDDKTDDLFN